jgi:hypothetical protein
MNTIQSKRQLDQKLQRVLRQDNAIEIIKLAKAVGLNKNQLLQAKQAGKLVAINSIDFELINTLP